MDRREFLRRGAMASAALGLGGIGCSAAMDGLAAAQVPSIADLQSLDMGGFLARLDSSLGFIGSRSSLDGLVSAKVQRDARKDPRFERAEELVRSTFRAALLTGSFGDLPEEGRAHPGVQARIWSSLQEMDEAVLGVNTMLSSITPSERADVCRLLREDATLGPRVLGAIDDEATRAGINARRRDHLQEIGKHLCFRMRQSTSLLIDEYGERVKKVSARDASLEGIERRLRVQMGEEAFWRYRARQGALAQAWRNVPGTAQLADAPTNWQFEGAPTGRAEPPTEVRAEARAATPEQERAERFRASGKRLTVGGLMFGFGVLGCISGALIIVTTGSSGLLLAAPVLLTPAVGLTVTGVILLMIGGINRARV